MKQRASIKEDLNEEFAAHLQGFESIQGAYHQLVEKYNFTFRACMNVSKFVFNLGVLFFFVFEIIYVLLGGREF